MRALTGSFAFILLMGATLLIPAPPLAQGSAVSAQPVTSGTQNRNPANILVVGPSDSVGAMVTTTVRNGLASDTSGRPVWLIPQKDIDDVLRLAGFDGKAKLSQSDMQQFANFIRADMWVSLSIEQTDGAFRARASVAGVRDAVAHDLSRNMVGSVDAISDQLVRAIRQDSTYLQLRRRQP